MIPDTPERLHHKEASELQSTVSEINCGVEQIKPVSTAVDLRLFNQPHVK